MCICRCTICKDEIKPKNIRPLHNNPEVFITSQWQSDKSSPSYIYCFTRLAIFSTFVTIWILSYTLERVEIKNYWPVFLTNWGMTMCVIQSFLGALMVFCTVLGTKVFDNSVLTEPVMRLYPTYWVFNVIATVLSFTITFIYWSLLYAAQGSYWSTMNFMVHGMNSIIMFLDLCIVSHPVRILHFIYPILLALVYLFMTILFYLCGGKLWNGDRFIYPILDWGTPGTTVGVCCGVLVLMTIFHMVCFLVEKVRTRLARRCFGQEPEKNEYMYDLHTQSFNV